MKIPVNFAKFLRISFIHTLHQSQIIELESRVPLKKISSSEDMTTSLIKILETPNSGHMTTSIVLLESSDKILLVTL